MNTTVIQEENKHGCGNHCFVAVWSVDGAIAVCKDCGHAVTGESSEDIFNALLHRTKDDVEQCKAIEWKYD